MEEKQRSSFSGRIGFVLAAAGSAVGLGNLWRFPYLAAKYGAGTFLIVYVILSITFGFTLLVTEIAIGRKTGLSCIQAYKKLDKRFSFLGWIASAVPMIIVPYYCVIGGWVIKYFAGYLSGAGSKISSDSEGYFNNFITVSESGIASNPMLWFVIFVVLTALVVLFGVEKGIEKVSKIMMPVLVVLSIIIAGFSLSVEGGLDGLKYYLIPDFSNFSINTILGALGQLFYSMSLAMGIMITYGSYMKKDVDLEKSVRQIEFFDTGIAFIAGAMIIPAVYAFNGGDPEKINAGPGLMFITLPKVFETMPLGNFVGALFFVLVLFAALTSSISLLETVVSIFQDKFGWGRKVTTIIVSLGVIALGTLSCYGYGPFANVKLLGMQFLDFFDFISNSIIMPIVAFLTCILIGYVTGPEIISEEVCISSPFRRKKLHKIMIKVIAPLLLLAILISQILSYFGLITI